jgi:hypothetical protein
LRSPSQIFSSNLSVLVNPMRDPSRGGNSRQF